MKRRKYIQLILGLLTLIIVVGTTLLNSPRVQQRASVWVATELENRIGTRVGIGSVRWLLPGDIIIDNLTIDDQEGEPLIAVSRLAAKVEWMPLIRHRHLSVRNIRIFAPNLNFYRTSSEEDYNYQFLIDAFASKKEKEAEKRPSRLTLRINSLLVRHAKVSHRIGHSEEAEQTTKSIVQDLSITDLSTQLSLKHLSSDSVSLIVRHLELEEQSGIEVNHLYLRFVGNRRGATLANFQLDLPHSSLQLDTIWAAYLLDEHLRIQRESEGTRMPLFAIKGGILPKSYITPSDLTWMAPEVGGINEKIYFGAQFIGSPSAINVTTFDLHTSQRDFTLCSEAHIALKTNQSEAREQVEGESFLNLHEVTLSESVWTTLSQDAPQLYNFIPQELIRVGDIAGQGTLRYDTHQTLVTFAAQTDAGDLDLHLSLDDNGHYDTSIKGDSLCIAQVLPQSPLMRTNLILTSQGILEEKGSTGEVFNLLNIKNKKIGNSSLKATFTHTRLLEHEYQCISLDGIAASGNYETTITLDDPCGTLSFNATYNTAESTPQYTAMLRADSIDLHTIGLIDIHEGKTFSTRIKANLQGPDFDHMIGRIIIDSLTMHRYESDFRIDEMALYISDPEDKMLSFKSDFMDVTARGAFTYSSLASSLLHHLHHSLPSLCHSDNHDHSNADNICLANVNVYNTQPLRELLLIPIDITGKAEIRALINDPASELKLEANIPQIDYDGTTLKAISVDCHSQHHGLSLHAGATLMQGIGNSITTNLITRAENDKVDLGAVWNSNPTGMFEGSFHTRAAFSLDHNGNLGVAIEADSTRATINHSEWNLSSFGLDITPERLFVDRLHLEGDSTQHLSAHGTIAADEADTLKIDFSGLDLSYILQLVKFEAVPFGGTISGHADIANLHTAKPYLDATLNAQNFTFSYGDMGQLNAHAYWNSDDPQLHFVADVWEDTLHTSVIDGTVDLDKDELWLDITADSLNASFLNSMLGSFMSNITGYASGDITIGGPLTDIDLTGALFTDMAFTLTPTYTDYHFRDSLRFTPGTMHFNAIDIYDNREQKGIVSGTVTHDKLREFSCDLYVDIQNMLGIDLPDTGHDNFYTTIYGTGGIHVNATPTTLDIDIQAQPERGSLFALNIAGKDDSSGQKFITFTDRSATRNVPTAATRKRGKRRRARSEAEQGTMLDLDITAHVTPDAILKLVMDQSVDDHISASGSGDLQISIKGDDINLFGTYTINRGFYRLSLQDVINKNFDVLPGSTVSFEGDPMNARLDITARHAANYVPLRDLSPDMTGNVVVNCLLRIGGTLETPTVTFDLELPKGTEEEKAMLRSYTSTEEQMNMQFVYLLGLGKFYTADMAQNTQGTGNVESFISNTISGQINNLLAGIISSDNWNIAGNIRAENMMTGVNDLGGENWENMEIEGILEGRLLDNRLLINGNFGYRENPMYATNFIGDFDIRYLLTGGLSVKGYNKTNDRYFSRTSLTTQGVGLVFQRDFDRLWPRRKRKNKKIILKQLPELIDTTCVECDSLIIPPPFADSLRLVLLNNTKDIENNQ